MDPSPTLDVGERDPGRRTLAAAAILAAVVAALLSGLQIHLVLQPHFSPSLTALPVTATSSCLMTSAPP